MSTGYASAYIESKYEKQLNKAMRFTTYKGCTIEQRADGFYWFGRNRGATVQEAMNAIDNASMSLQHSIKTITP